jgi:hypothetical protein
MTRSSEEGQQRSYTITLVHGTFARGAAWTQEGSFFRQHLETCLGERSTFRQFNWSGENSHQVRDRAAAELAIHIHEVARSNPDTQALSRLPQPWRQRRGACDGHQRYRAIDPGDHNARNAIHCLPTAKPHLCSSCLKMGEPHIFLGIASRAFDLGRILASAPFLLAQARSWWLTGCVVTDHS